MHVETMREKLFTMRMSDEETGRLDFLAKHYGLNGAGVLRMLIKREVDTVSDATGKQPTLRKKEAAKPTKK